MKEKKFTKFAKKCPWNKRSNIVPEGYCAVKLGIPGQDDSCNQGKCAPLYWQEITNKE